MKIPDFDKMGQDELYDWVEKQHRILSTKEFTRLWASCGKAFARRMETLDKLRKKVIELYDSVAMFDDVVAGLFDVDSDKMMEKKYRVLKALDEGKNPEEIGKDYLDILEKIDKDALKDGRTIMVEGVEIDPKKYN